MKWVSVTMLVAFLFLSLVDKECLAAEKEIEKKQLGIGFFVAPAGVGGASVRYWFSPDWGLQVLAGGYIDTTEDEEDSEFNYGVGLLYQIRETETTRGYVGVGVGGYVEDNEHESWTYQDDKWLGKEWEESLCGGQIVMGVERFIWFEGFSLNLEAGIAGGRKVEKEKLEGEPEKEKKGKVLGVGLGLGFHYYF